MDKSNTAYLQTLSFAKLANKDGKELEKLLDACQHQGFFYLDLAGSDAAQGLEDRLKALSLTKEWFDRPLEEKMKLRQDSVTKGYKPIGTLSGVVKDKKDGFENIKMPRDDFINGNNTLPEGLNQDLATFKRDLECSHTVTTTILSCLSDLLTPETRFEDHHRGSEASQSTMMYFRYVRQHDRNEGTTGVGHNMHTDLGTLTLLYCEQWGLQVYDQSRDVWAYVEPKPGKYVVNVGDALRFLSGNALLSALHRVVPVPGHEGEYRYSTAYFLRPENGARFRTSENTFVSALDWHDRKYDIFKADHAEQEKNTILTGGIGVKG
ncbi:2OG-Fe(II) oxygenase family oxidoreductase [Xylariaceae sp. FL0594]|nr:2OG-Fe(II) oxygenase family oxidoreductase [Xylariaceae sp. FL0594]